MLSVATITVGQAKNYYTDDNYYTKDQGVENSMWHGSLAGSMGLSGQVDVESFHKLLSGESLDGKTQLIERKSVIDGHKFRAGTDLTLSAPKSVTLASLYDDRLIEAHNKAVAKTLSVVEQEFSYVRRGRERTIEKTGNLIFATFNHDTSRKAHKNLHPDPQLHTHAVCMNMTQANDGKYLSVHNDGMFQNSKLIGCIYQNELAKEILRLGYEIKLNNNGTFDINGYSREQIDAFSKRTKEIEALGARSKKEERKLKLGSRIKKGDEISREDLYKLWKEEIEKEGILYQRPRPHKDFQIQAIDPSFAINSAIRHLSERDVSFRDKKAIEFALAENIGQVESFDQLKNAIKINHEIIPYKTSRSGDIHYTTTDALLLEKETIHLLSRGKNSFKAILNSSEIDHLIDGKEADKKYTSGQEQAVRSALSSKDQFIGWQGVAGAGKSYALGDVRKVAESKGFEILGLAPDAESAQTLKESAAIQESMTISRFLQKDPERTSAKKLWIVDEAGKVSAKNMQTLFEKATYHNARVILVGDTKQLSAVEAGNPFKSLIRNGMQTAFLNEHRRQKESKLKSAVELFSRGEVEESLAQLRKNIREYKKRDTRIDKIASDYIGLTIPERRNTLILTGTNENKDLLTSAIRDRLKEEGRVTKSIEIEAYRTKDLTREQAKFAHNYDVNDIVTPLSANKRLGLEKSGSYTIKEIKDKTITFESTDKKSIIIDPSKIGRKAVYESKKIEFGEGDLLRWTKNDSTNNRRNGQVFRINGINKDQNTLLISYIDTGKEETIPLISKMYVDHALVMTAFSSQGRTVDRVMVAADHAMGKESMYVAISRARYEVGIYASSFEDLITNAKRSQTKQTAEELISSAPSPSHNASLSGPKLEEIKENLIESKNTLDQYQAILNSYLEKSEKQKLQTAIVTTSQKERNSLQNFLRNALKARGLITDEKSVQFLTPISKAKNHEHAQYLIPTKGNSNHGIEKGTIYKVEKIMDNDAHILSPRGIAKVIPYKDLACKLYTAHEGRLGKGDTVTLPSKRNLRGVVQNTNERITVAFEDGSIRRFKSNAPLPLRPSLVETIFEHQQQKRDLLFCLDRNTNPKQIEYWLKSFGSKLKLFAPRENLLDSGMKTLKQQKELMTHHQQKQAAKSVSNKELGLGI